MKDIQIYKPNKYTTSDYEKVAEDIYKTTIETVATKPNSSPITAKIKSVVLGYRKPN